MEIIVPSQTQQLDDERDKDHHGTPKDTGELTNAGFQTAAGHGALSDQTGGGIVAGTQPGTDSGQSSERPHAAGRPETRDGKGRGGPKPNVHL